MAYRDRSIYGVTIHLANNKILNGYIETDWLLYSCKESKNDFKDGDQYSTWESLLKRQRDDIRAGLRSIDTVTFIYKINQIKFDHYVNNKFIAVPLFVTAKSSVKEIKIDNIKLIKGVCRKWDGLWTDFGVEVISDYMAEYISNHKMIASYSYRSNAVDEPFEIYTVYFSYNPDYPRKRLIKERKVIGKMSDDILDEHKLIRFTYTAE